MASFLNISNIIFKNCSSPRPISLSWSRLYNFGLFSGVIILVLIVIVFEFDSNTIVESSLLLDFLSDRKIMSIFEYKSSSLYGLIKKSFMPANKYTSMSCLKALAVSAIIGVLHPIWFLIILVASTPSILGICISIKIISYELFFKRSTASSPFSASVTMQ